MRLKKEDYWLLAALLFTILFMALYFGSAV